MKTIQLTILLIFLCFLGTSQTKTEFAGAISINEGDVLSYKLTFIQEDNLRITGYSITDLNGESLTKSSIIGEYDTIKKNLSFKELGNIYSKIDDDDSTFCFVHAEKLKIKEINGVKFITGNFQGLFPNGDVCAEGKIFFTESNVIKKVKSIADSIKTIKNLPAELPGEIKEFNDKQNVVLMSNDKLLIDFSGNFLTLEVWDGAILDNDKIKIYLNDSLIEQEITLTKSKKTIELPANLKLFKVKIVALNIGDTGINTVNFALKDAIEIKEFTSRLNKGESFEAEFRRR